MEDQLDRVSDLTNAFQNQLLGSIRSVIQGYEDMAAAAREAWRAAAQAQAEAIKTPPIVGNNTLIPGGNDDDKTPGGNVCTVCGKDPCVCQKELVKPTLKGQFGWITGHGSNRQFSKIYTDLGQALTAAEKAGYTGNIYSISSKDLKFDERDPISIMGSVSQLRAEGFDTGGYTGAWGPSGKLAMLHQKELVLNQEDTSNILNAVSIMRDVMTAINIPSLASSLVSPMMAGFNSSPLEQMVTIEANFPGVQDRYEIEEAFYNLINTASQFANRKKI